MSLIYSPVGCVHENSLIGDKMNCVVVSEIIDHPEVKLQCDSKFLVNMINSNGFKKILFSPDPDRNRLSDSEGGKVPNKYLIVRNNDLVVNRYLLVFAQEKSSTNSNSPSRGSNIRTGFKAR